MLLICEYFFLEFEQWTPQKRYEFCSLSRSIVFFSSQAVSLSKRPSSTCCYLPTPSRKLSSSPPAWFRHVGGGVILRSQYQDYTEFSNCFFTRNIAWYSIFWGGKKISSSSKSGELGGTQRGPVGILRSFWHTTHDLIWPCKKVRERLSFHIHICSSLSYFVGAVYGSGPFILGPRFQHWCVPLPRNKLWAARLSEASWFLCPASSLPSCK